MDKPKMCTTEELNAMSKEELVALVEQHQTCAAGKCEGGKCTGAAPAAASCNGAQ
ncbi:MAG: hypothetical protein NBV63_01915 [Candidatus Pacebacteria bacterium]|nr:hypothetical protein [Candidatus Paceibacterota bacterium]